MLRLRVREVAQEKNMSMHRLSMKSEISYHVIREIFTNPYRRLSTYIIDKIAEALEVPVTDIIEDVPKWRAEEERKRLKGHLESS